MQQKTLLYCADLLETKLHSAIPLQGGSINNVYLMHCEDGDFVVKINNADAFPDLFRREAEGLSLLRQSGSILCPEVQALGINEGDSVLILEYIEQGQASKSFWVDFGASLAALHKQTAPYFGLEKDNYIGSLPQDNQSSPSWVSFFITQRLCPQIEWAEESKYIDKETSKEFNQLFKELPNLLPEEAPSLIHGDLWTGNFLINKYGKAVLIDPAICFASREMDLAMSELFGKFSPYFYESYQAHFPLEPGHKERMSIYQLYYLLVHVNLFGPSYLTNIRRILARFQ